MSEQSWWYLARATGLVAWGLLSAAVIAGLLLGTRLLRGRPSPAWLLDLHRFLGGTAVALTALHLASLVADDHVTFGPLEILVPFTSSWRPGAVTLGVLALYLLVAVEATSLAMKRLPRRVWRGVHLTSYLAFWSATFHLLLAGRDATHPLVRLASAVVVVVVVFLTLVRTLAGRGGSRRRTTTAAPESAARESAAPSAPAVTR